MFKTALILLVLDLLFTFISWAINPEAFAQLEQNPFLWSKWYLALMVNAVWFALLHHALRIKSKFYVFVYSLMLIGVRTYAVLSHPSYWAYLIIPSIWTALVAVAMQISTSLTVFILMYRKWLNERIHKTKN